MDLDAIENSGKSTLILSSLPAWGEAFAMGIIAWLLFTILPLNIFNFSIWGFLLVASMFAMSSPAIIIPLILQAKQNNKKSNLFFQMTGASIMDTFTLLPFVLIFLNLAITIGIGNNDVSASAIVIKILVTIVMIIVAYLIGHLFGYIVGIIYNKGLKNVIAMGILLVAGNLIVVILTGPLGASLGLIIQDLVLMLKQKKGRLKDKFI